MRRCETRQGKKRLFWMLYTLLSLLPSAVLSGRYAPVLDDFIMYRGYYLYDISYLLGTVRPWTTRPVANLLDIFLWSHFHECLFALFLIFALMRVAAVYFLCDFLDRQGWEGAKMPLLTLLLFYPMGVEATGWLAASSRIVVGLLFLSLALFCLTRNRWIPFSVLLFLSFGCYEQFIFLGFCLAVYDIWFRNRKKLWIPLAEGFGMAAYYVFCNRWNQTPRMNFAWDRTVVSQIWNGWKKGLFPLIPESFRRGFHLFSEQWWLFVVLAILVGLVLRLWKPEKNSRKFGWAMGIAVFVSCHLPFLILGGNGLSFRVLYLPLIGIALLFPGGNGWWRKPLFAVLISVFCIGSAGELKDYQIAGESDLTLLQETVETAENGQITSEERLFLHEPSVFYGQHIVSVFHSEWSFNAGIRAVTGNVNAETTLEQP